MLKKNVAKAIRSTSPHGRAPIALLVMGIFLATATGVALAQDSDADSATTNGADQTTTAEESTTTAEETSTAEETTTSDETSTSEEAVDAGAQTTTTSDELNAQSLESAAVTTTPKGKVECDPKAEDESNKINNPQAGTTEVTVDTVTLTFVFSSNTQGSWTSSAPFTGQIIVKSGSGSGDGDKFAVYDYTNATSGTISTPATNQNNQPQAISHVEVCGEGGTTTTTTTTEPTTSTTTSTVTTSTTSTTSTPSTTTVPTTTGGFAGETGGGGGGGGEAGEKKQSDPGGVAREAATSDGLPFTGLHAPLLALIGLGTAALGFSVRRRLQDLD